MKCVIIIKLFSILIIVMSPNYDITSHPFNRAINANSEHPLKLCRYSVMIYTYNNTKVGKVQTNKKKKEKRIKKDRKLEKIERKKERQKDKKKAVKQSVSIG